MCNAARSGRKIIDRMNKRVHFDSMATARRQFIGRHVRDGGCLHATSVTHQEHGLGSSMAMLRGLDLRVAGCLRSEDAISEQAMGHWPFPHHRRPLRLFVLIACDACTCLNSCCRLVPETRAPICRLGQCQTTTGFGALQKLLRCLGYSV
jgi:hypothetical protein